jgi:ribonuclease D
MKESGVNSTLKIVNITDMFDIDNSYYPFIPKIKVKLFAMKELSVEIEDAKILRNQNIEKFRQIKYEDRKEVRDSLVLFEHPYKEEIVTLVNRVSDTMDIFNNYVKREYFSNHSMTKMDSIVNFKSIKIADIVSDHGMLGAFEKIREINKFHYFLFAEHKLNADSCKDLLEQYEFEFPPLEWTKFSYIDTPEAFLSMIAEIEQNFQEIAVDLEHHSLESYLGITCLMQISTRLADYVIDTIKLRPYIHEINRIFCNPAIVKVLHGADFDVEWLQKDFGVYIVNMFDTGQASRVLMLPSYSLANLLNTLCNISADKKYQLADWRIRPLPAEMLKYAREDTHYLLYIYDILRKKLIYKSSLKNEDILSSFFLTYKKSNELCLKQYIKPPVKSQEYYQLLSRNISVLNKRNMSILKIIYKFRDYVGRKLDVNPHHVLSNKNIFTLLKLPGNKFDAETIYQHLDKNSHIRNFVPDLAKMIEAKLKKNEEKIEKGMTSKFLEKNYIENMKEKFEESKNIVKNLKILSKVKKNLEITNKPETITKEEIKLAGQEISLKTKNPSKFIEEEKENFNKSTNIHVPPPEFNSMYNKVLENFNNYNIISYLKEKHPNLKNMKIEKKEAGIKTAVNTEKISAVVESFEKVSETEKILNQETKQENFLKQKRKGADISDLSKNKGVIDLTDYKRINLFKPPQDYSDEEDEVESISAEEEYTKIIKNNKKPKEFVNLKTIQSESVKNMIASAKFLKGKIKL